jgi:large subunit ribosomal protein L17
MRHLNKGRKFHREKNVRKAFLKSLMSALIVHQKITTTRERAKEISPMIQKAVTKAKKGDLAAMRSLRETFSEPLVKKLVELGKKYKDRKGGYVRIVHVGPRKSDAAPMSIIEFV